MRALALSTQPEDLGTKDRSRAAHFRLEIFVESYVANGGNATDAARAAGCRGTPGSLRVTGHRLLTRANVTGRLASALRERLKGSGADEVVATLKAQAVGLLPTRTATVAGETREEYDRLAALTLLARVMGLSRGPERPNTTNELAEVLISGIRAAAAARHVANSASPQPVE